MKISESKLREMVREVIVELTTSARTSGKMKLGRGEKSAEYKSAEADVRTADTALKSAETTKKSASNDYDTAKATTRTKQQATRDAQSDLDAHRRNEPKITTPGGSYPAANPREIGNSAEFRSTDGRRFAYTSNNRSTPPRGYGSWAPNPAWTTWSRDDTTKDTALGTARSEETTAVADERTKKTTFDNAVADERTKRSDRDRKETLRKQKETKDIKARNTAAEPTADEPKPPKGGAGTSTRGKGRGKGKGKGKGKKDESLFKILGRDTLMEIKELENNYKNLKKTK